MSTVRSFQDYFWVAKNKVKKTAHEFRKKLNKITECNNIDCFAKTGNIEHGLCCKHDEAWNKEVCDFEKTNEEVPNKNNKK